MTTSTPHTAKVKTKRRPPARSAKILTVGLSTTAMLGMTTGYAFADLNQKQNLPATNNTQVDTASSTAITETQNVAPAQTPIAPTSPVEIPTPVVPPTVQAQTPVSTQQEVVIDVPAPQSSGATPGSGNSSWQNQPSSGSN